MILDPGRHKPSRRHWLINVFLIRYRAVRLFKRCTSPVKSSCGRGVKMLLSSQPDLHKYLLKMNVICRRRVLPGELSFLFTLSCENHDVVIITLSSNAACLICPIWDGIMGRKISAISGEDSERRGSLFSGA